MAAPKKGGSKTAVAKPNKGSKHATQKAAGVGSGYSKTNKGGKK